MPGLGRIYAPDPRDALYPMRAAIPRAAAVESRYWDDDAWWGDQGDSPECVGYSWTHWLEDGPVLHLSERAVPPVIQPSYLYQQAQLVDEWDGNNYEGTSVRAAAKVLASMGYITEYRWGQTIQDVAIAVLEVGPVVVGTTWTYDMFTPDEDGRIYPSGPEMGGHAYVLNGYDSLTGMFRIKNSWGRSWGIEGHAYIHRDDMAALLAFDGEACLALEHSVEPTPEPGPTPEPDPDPTPEPVPDPVPEPTVPTPDPLGAIWGWLVRFWRWLTQQ